MRINPSYTRTAVVAFASFLAVAAGAEAATVANPLCTDNTALFDPGTGQNIVLPAGFTVSVFAKGLNMPTGIAFLGNAQQFQVYVLESGHGLPSGCEDKGISILATRLPPTFWCSTRTATRSRAPWVNRPEAAASRPAAFKPRDRRSTSRSNVASREDGSSPPTPIRQPTLRDKTTAHAS